MLIRVAVTRFLSLAVSLDPGFCRDSWHSFISQIVLSHCSSIWSPMTLHREMWHKSTRDCRFLWQEVEDMTVQVLFSSIVQVSGKHFCKLVAGCVTVAVVSALAFIPMVTSLGYGLLPRDSIPRVGDLLAQRLFWTNFWSNSSSKLQTWQQVGLYNTYHNALWYTENPVSNHSWSTSHTYILKNYLWMKS